MDIDQAYNTIDKFGPKHADLHSYPHFFGRNMKKLYKLRETTSRASARKHKRTLSIVSKEGRVFQQ